MNERKTENIVRDLLRENGYYNDPNIIVEEQSSDNPKIDKLLKTASKSGKGKGYPEFIISFKDQIDKLVVIECKADISKHESKDRKQYKDYAVDGALLYADYLKDDFTVTAIAVSGETEREVKISHFLWLKGKHAPKSINDKTILNPDSLFKVIEKQDKPFSEEEITKKAIEYNEKLHKCSIPETERCTLISSILVALQDDIFSTTYLSYHHDSSYYDSYNPNTELINSLIDACRKVLKRNKISSEKQEIILREYEQIKQNSQLTSAEITGKKERKKEIPY